MYAWCSLGLRDIDTLDLCIGIRTAQEDTVNHVRESYIGWIDGGTADSLISIDSGMLGAHDVCRLPRLRLLACRRSLRDRKTFHEIEFVFSLGHDVPPLPPLSL